MVIKENFSFFFYQWKFAIHLVCQKKYRPTARLFLAIFEGTSRKTYATFSNQF